MEVSTLEDFIYNQDFNIPMKITYKIEDDNNDLEKSIFEHYLIKPYLSSNSDRYKEIEKEEGCIYPNEGVGNFVLYRWPPEIHREDTEPYYICEVIRVRHTKKYSTIATLKKLKPFLMLSLVYDMCDYDKNMQMRFFTIEKRFYKYYKGVYDDGIQYRRSFEEDYRNGGKHVFKNINEFMVFCPNWTDY